MKIEPSTARFRSIWISDIHLGTRGCQAQILLDFLKKNESEYLYLAGDIIDGWRLKRNWYWPQEHDDIVQKILRKARKGTHVVFVPGNHDEFAREYANLPYWSLSAYLKLKVKNAVKYIAEFETALAKAAAAEGVDGIVCGHIHHAEMREIDGVLYCNDGDWVESCSALVEHHDGRLELIYWALPAPARQQSKAEVAYA